MRRLMLLRHAKSAYPEGVADPDRPLAERGRKTAPRMGRYLASQQLTPDLAIVSTARRAQETWELTRVAFTRDIGQRDERRIYEASARAILEVVRETAADVRTLLLVGHNPGFEDLALQLIGEAEDAELARLKNKYPTAGLAVIDFDVKRWSKVAPGAGKLERFETPRTVES
jgi:phosphohistidine phosphatase